MGSSYCSECNNCECKFFTSGPWELRWDKNVKIEYRKNTSWDNKSFID